MSLDNLSNPELLTDLWIGGKAVPASDGGRFDVLDPATGRVLTTVADGSVDDAIAAVDAADGAAAGWAATSPRERAEILRRAWELMTEQADDLAKLVTLENGKALADAKGEVAYAAEFFRWYSEEAVRAVGQLMTAPSGANKIMVLQQPVGICVLVTPWNFPAAMATRKIGPALAAGRRQQAHRAVQALDHRRHLTHVDDDVHEHGGNENPPRQPRADVVANHLEHAAAAREHANARRGIERDHDHRHDVQRAPQQIESEPRAGQQTCGDRARANHAGCRERRWTHKARERADKRQSHQECASRRASGVCDRRRGHRFAFQRLSQPPSTTRT